MHTPLASLRKGKCPFFTTIKRQEWIEFWIDGVRWVDVRCWPPKFIIEVFKNDRVALENTDLCWLKATFSHMYVHRICRNSLMCTYSTNREKAEE